MHPTMQLALSTRDAQTVRFPRIWRLYETCRHGRLLPQQHAAATLMHNRSDELLQNIGLKGWDIAYHIACAYECEEQTKMEISLCDIAYNIDKGVKI